jgi:hypothetical protein
MVVIPAHGHGLGLIVVFDDVLNSLPSVDQTSGKPEAVSNQIKKLD